MFAPLDRSRYGGLWKLSGVGRHDRGWAHITLPPKANVALRLLQAKIDKDDLAEDGMETEPHITVKYGLTGVTYPELVEETRSNGGGKVRLGVTSLFENPDADVLKVSAVSHALHALHKSLSRLPNDDKYPEYTPHATVAYLKPGKGKKYVGLTVAEGIEFSFDQFGYRDERDRNYVIRLDGKKQAEAGYGDIALLQPHNIVDFVLQKHTTDKRPTHPHYDLRLGTPKTQMFSFAIPKAELPPEGERRLAIRTPLHSSRYSRFYGRLGKGKGTGTVERVALDKATIGKTTAKTVEFTTGGKTYVLIHTGGKDGNSWQLYTKPTQEKVAGVSTVPLVFRTKTGQVRGRIVAEVADTPELRRKGLSKRANLLDGHGMFFDKAGAFWMKDVAFPLDIVFVDKKGTVVDAQTMKVASGGRLPLYSSFEATAEHAIEVPAGWCKRHGVTVGDAVRPE